MIVNASIEKIISDGYERLIKISTEDSQICSLWCYFVDTEVFVDSQDKTPSISVGENIPLELLIDLVNNFSVTNNCKTSYNQSIEDSSHIEVVANVTRVVDEYTLICDIAHLKEISVEFENKLKNLNVGDTIEFTGNLKAQTI